ncbi:MAG: Zn-ribbon domain-containing OB-fold protein [Acidimicrobiales bacterium]
MTELKERVPAIDGWFTTGDAPALLGSRCTACGTYFFPRESAFCRNPACSGRAFEGVELSRRGRIWSFTDNRFKPPPPYVSPEPFVPYTIAAVELAAERIVVLGQMAAGVDPAGLRAGLEVELVLGTLYTDDEHEYLVWNWRPVDAGEGGR